MVVGLEFLMDSTVRWLLSVTGEVVVRNCVELPGMTGGFSVVTKGGITEPDTETVTGFLVMSVKLSFPVVLERGGVDFVDPEGLGLLIPGGKMDGF